MSAVRPQLPRGFIGAPGPQPRREDLATLEQAEIGRISEIVGPLYTLDAGIRPLFEPALPIIGPACTAKCPPGDNLAAIAAIAHARAGDIIVIDARGFTGACLGGARLLEHAVRRLGVRGFVLDGAFRDIEECRAAGLPLYGRGINPWSGPKVAGGEVNVPVACGGVVIAPGDVVCASVEGIVSVPARLVAEVAALLRLPLDPQRHALETTDRAVADYVARMHQRLQDMT